MVLMYAELVLVMLYFENLPQITTMITSRFIEMTSPVFNSLLLFNIKLRPPSAGQ